MDRSEVAQDSPSQPAHPEGEVSSVAALSDITTAPSNGKREPRARRVGDSRDQTSVDRQATGAETSEDAASVVAPRRADREASRIARGERRQRPRAPRAEQIAAPVSPATDEIEPAGEPTLAPEPATAAEALIVSLSGKNPDRAARTLKRARRKQQAAAAAVAGAEDNPALGALNRHLNMMVQQLGAAHRVIGRVAAERDALRQQLADLQGIPVDEIVVTMVGAAPDLPLSSRATKPSEPKPKTGLARLNYFGGEDVAVMRKRRQTFVVGLLVLVLVLWLGSKMGVWQTPNNISRESLTGLPYVGEIMSYVLGGWLLFRFVRVSSKGVKWVFPSDDPRRRRR